MGLALSVVGTVRCPIFSLAAVFCMHFDRGAGPTFQIPTIIMSTSIDSDEPYLGQSPSISQLLRVAKRKLQDIAFGRWFVQGS